MLLVGFGAIVARLVDVQAVGGDEYTTFGVSQRFQDITLPADRGSIFDRNGNDLAVSLPQQTVWANPQLIKHPLEVATALAGPLALDAAATTALADKLSGDAEFVYVSRRVDDAVADGIAELELPGVAFLEEPERIAPAGDLARSVLGQVGVDNDGLSGLERQYDDALTGEPGELIIEKDPDGRTIPGGEHQRVPAQRGDDLVLTIDRSMQYETERALAAQILAKGAKGGTAIVTRPETGEILALANFTTDPETGAIVATGNNMGATAVYEPGSVNKVITVAAALEEGLVTPDTELTVPDSYQVSDHLYTDHDPHPTESYSVTRILTESSNIGTIKLAQMLGKDRLDTYLRRFGFGTKTALDFPNEAAGQLLHPEDYSGTSIGSIPIGQGISVTALQMMEAYNVLANDGVYVPPKLVLETIDAAGTRQPVQPGEPRRVVSEATAEQMREMLVNVVAEGTGTARRHHRLLRGRQDRHRPQAAAGGRLPGRRRQLPLRRELRGVRAGRGPRAVDHRRDRRAGRRHLRRHRGRPGLRRPRPVRPAPLPHRPAAGGGSSDARHRGSRGGGGRDRRGPRARAGASDGRHHLDDRPSGG